MRGLAKRTLTEAPPVVAAALLAELVVPRLGSPLRELPYFFALWACCAWVWSGVLGIAGDIRAIRARQRV